MATLSIALKATSLGTLGHTAQLDVKTAANLMKWLMEEYGMNITGDTPVQNTIEQAAEAAMQDIFKELSAKVNAYLLEKEKINFKSGVEQIKL